jgi:membrane-bound ClpP family serine protease
METFWTLLKESVILQAILTVGIWAAVIYLIVVGKEVPEVLTMAANLVLGFYFGSKLALNRGG